MDMKFYSSESGQKKTKTSHCDVKIPLREYFFDHLTDYKRHLERFVYF
jgi:hypothetical protein